VKVREILLFSQFLTINSTRFESLSHICLETNRGFTPNQPKNPEQFSLGFFVLNECNRLNALECLEGFCAIQAAVQRLAGG
jgi:hypothetical protein